MVKSFLIEGKFSICRSFSTYCNIHERNSTTEAQKVQFDF